MSLSMPIFLVWLLSLAQPVPFVPDNSLPVIDCQQVVYTGTAFVGTGCVADKIFANGFEQP